MTHYVCIFLSGLFACSGIALGGDCASITPETADRMTRYIHARFNFPASAQISLRTIEEVGNTCFRRVHFQAEGAGRLDIAFFLSPDQKFITRELMDLSLNPEDQRRDNERAMATELSRGVFPTRGSPDAPVTITIFSDFECPYCRQEAANLGSDKLTEMKVRIVFRNLPLPMHPWAREAADMAACIYKQSNDAFWEVHDYLFRNQPDISVKNINEKSGEHNRPEI